MSLMNNPSFARGLALFVLTGSLFLGRTVSAQVLVAPGIYAFTSQASYEAASYSIVDAITFNGLPPSQSSYSDYSTTGLNVAGVTFTTSANNFLYVVGPGYASQYDFPGDGTSTLAAQADSPSPADLAAALPSGTSAVGTEIAGSFDAASVTVTITLTDGMTATYAYAAADGQNGLGFLGFVTTGANQMNVKNQIESISFSDSTEDITEGSDLTFDDFTYGVANFVPEPAPLALLAIGGVALFLFRRRLATR
jgi:hypothetical protein